MAAAKKKTTSNSGLPIEFVSSGSVKEEHGKPIYCVAWSDDIFVEEEEQQEAVEMNVGASSSNNNSSKHRQCYYRCFASCADRTVTIYEVEIPDPTRHHHHKNSYRSGDFIVKQSYVDPDKGEDFYACAFGGRSFGKDLGFIPSSVKINRADPKSRTFKKRKVSDGVVFSPTRYPRVASNTNDDTNNNDNDENDEYELVDRVTLTYPTSNQFPPGPHLDPSGPQLLCVGGKRFSIKVIDTTRLKLFMTLSGHGDEISSLKFSPVDEWILLSASNDRSCRLWNLSNGTCFAIFAGHEGHLDSVLTANWHPYADKIVSGSHDTLVKIWDVQEGSKAHEAMTQSYSVKLRRNENGTYEPEDYFPPVICQFPIFSTNKVHVHPVDCVEFLGDLVLSKAFNTIVLWDPDYNKKGDPNVTHPPPSDVVVLSHYDVNKGDDHTYFYRFCTDSRGQMFASGNVEGEVIVREIESEDKGLYRKLSLRPRQKPLVRMTLMSPDDHILLCSCEDGSLYKWDITPTKK